MKTSSEKIIAIKSGMNNNDFYFLDDSFYRRYSVNFHLPEDTPSKLLKMTSRRASVVYEDLPRGSVPSLGIVVPEVTHGKDEHNQDLYNLSIREALKLISIIYAIVSSIVGLILPTAEALRDIWLDTVYGATFLAYQLIVGIAFLVYLFLLSYFLRKKDGLHHLPFESPSYSSPKDISNSLVDRRNSTELKHRNSICLNSRSTLNKKTENDDFETSSVASLSDSSANMVWVDVADCGDVFTHPETSLFLRVGSLVFSLGNLIYYGFESASYIYLDRSCSEGTIFGWTFFLRFIFVLLQTYFMFKRPDVHIKSHQSVIWFGMLHLVSTNICLWFRTVINEIFAESKHTSESGPGGHDSPPPAHDSWNLTNLDPHSLDLTNQSVVDCSNSFIQGLTPYLFPFVLEYSLIAFGTIGSILHSLTQTASSEDKTIRDIRNAIRVITFTSSQASTTSSDDSQAQSSASTKSEGMLNKSHTGFFFGALVITGMIVSTITFFMKNTKKSDLPTIIYLITDMCLHGILLVGCIVAFILMRPLAYVPKVMSIDDALIVISMCGSILLDLSIVIAAADTISSSHVRKDGVLEGLRAADSVVVFVQAIVQSLLLVCALRRYASRPEHSATMPGRGAITSLIIGNVTIWVYRTILAKGINVQNEQNFYGNVPWLLLVNINLPLTLFFRFHCSICLADVWHLAYKPLKQTVGGSKVGSVTPESRLKSAGSRNMSPDSESVGEEPVYAISRGRSSSAPSIHGVTPGRSGENLERTVPTNKVVDLDEGHGQGHEIV